MSQGSSLKESLHLTAEGNQGFAEAVEHRQPTMPSSEAYMWGYSQGQGFVRRMGL
jgi:hypothetical protein